MKGVWALLPGLYIAQARGRSDESLRPLVNQYTNGCQFGFPGEPAVDVLKRNLVLDGLK